MDDENEARFAAHRAALSALAMVLNEVAPGAFANFIEALATFEEGARQHNEHTAMIEEFQVLRSGLEAMAPSLPPATPAPPDDTDSR